MSVVRDRQTVQARHIRIVDLRWDPALGRWLFGYVPDDNPTAKHEYFHGESPWKPIDNRWPTRGRS